MTIDNIEPLANTFPEIEQCECSCVRVRVRELHKNACTFLLTQNTGDIVDVLAACENDMDRATDRLTDLRDRMDLKRGREGWYKSVVKEIKEA